jgi:hypothetical protein
MLLLNTKIRSVYIWTGNELINRLTRSKQMLKVRKKLNYEGKNRRGDYLDYTSWTSESSVKSRRVYDVAILLSCVLIFIGRLRNGHCTL